MKKTFTLTAKKLLSLLIFIVAQTSAWAVDTTTVTTTEGSNNIFTQPWIWIGVIVIIAIKLLGPFTQDTEEFVIVRKKTTKRK